jgi:hypothetical protein
MIKTMITSGLTALVVALVVVMLVGSNTPAVGGETRFPNSNVTAQDVTTTDDLFVADDATFGTANGSATTSISFNKACLTMTTDTGSTSYLYVTGVGTSARLATSTTACN